MSTTAIAEHRTVTEVVRRYEECVAGIRSAFAEVHKHETLLNRAFLRDGEETIWRLRVRPSKDRYGSIDWDDPTDCLLLLKQTVWIELVDRLELRRAMSIQRAKELDDQLAHPERLPEITVESVMQFAQKFRESFNDLFREQVNEVFDFLRPRNERFKTNTQYALGKRVILAYWLEQSYGSTFYGNHRYSQEMRALESVFQALDGKGIVNKGHKSQLEDAINRTPKDVGRCETEYFKARLFLNRNLHLEFKRLDLVKKLNMIAGGKRLACPEPKEGAAVQHVA